MFRNLLVCGLLAGLCAGLLATGFAQIAGESAIDQAIGVEAHKAAMAHEVAEPALVSRDLQKSVGLLTAAVGYGLAMGGLFALVFGVVYGRVGRASPARTALWLAAAAFVAIYLVPYIKYPPNPPAVGDPDTITRRTELYVTMVAVSLLAVLAAIRLRPLYLRRVAPSVATGLALASYLAVVIVAGLSLPGIHEVPKDFPATTLWHFREASMGMQAVIWTTIGLVFAVTAQRVMSGQRMLPALRRRERMTATVED